MHQSIQSAFLTTHTSITYAPIKQMRQSTDNLFDPRPPTNENSRLSTPDARLLLGGNDRCATLDLAPADEPPVLIDLPAESHLLADLGAHRVLQTDFRQIVPHGLDLAGTRQRADVDHQHLALLQLLDLGALLGALSAHTEQSPQQIERDLDILEDVRQLADAAQQLAHEPISAADLGIDLRADTDEATWHRECQIVLLGTQTHDARDDRAAGE